MEIENPLARILEHAGSIPVLGFLLSAFEILERLDFISTKTGELEQFFMSLHGAVATLLICVVWLTGIGFWLKIKSRLPVIKRRKTVLDRLRELEDVQIPGLSKKAAELQAAQTKIGSALVPIEEWVEELPGVRTAAGEALRRLDEYHPWVSDIERSTKAVEKRTANLESARQQITLALGSAPQIVIRLGEYDRLIAEATESLERLRDIREHYPNSAVSLKPFSEDWRPKLGAGSESPMTDAIRDGEGWIRLLAHHWRHLKSYGASRGENISDDLLTRLNAINTKPDMSWGEAERLLSDHLGRLETLRDGYAGAIKDNVLVGTAI
jgi:hypothetical protein